MFNSTQTILSSLFSSCCGSRDRNSADFPESADSTERSRLLSETPVDNQDESTSAPPLTNQPPDSPSSLDISHSRNQANVARRRILTNVPPPFVEGVQESSLTATSSGQKSQVEIPSTPDSSPAEESQLTLASQASTVSSSKHKATENIQPFPPREFQLGDLIYGLEEDDEMGVRRTYINKLAEEDPRVNAYPCRIDDYRLLTTEEKIPLAGVFRAHSNFSEDALAELKEVKEFKQQEQQLRETLAAHEKYKTALEPPKGQDDLNSKTRRKTKGALVWATKIAHKHVIFLLDSLDIEDVIKKRHPLDRKHSEKSKYRTYTGSELRWIYRNRTDPDVQKYVHFQENGKPCRPPWEEVVETKYQWNIQRGKMEKKEVNAPEKVEMWNEYRPRQ